MRTNPLSPSILLAVVTLTFVPNLAGQTSKPPPRKRLVNLETVLSCADDPLIGRIFGTDQSTAMSLNAILLALHRTDKPSNLEKADALLKGFVTDPAGDITHLAISPSDLSGHIIKGPMPFCHTSLVAAYKEHAYNSGPTLLEIDGDQWQFDPNEVLAHADQFQFSSGVFANSAGVYLMATKGRVSIQFTCSAVGLRFYRAMYIPPDE